jgi:KipI family sensor histidine kinase inhibitor
MALIDVGDRAVAVVVEAADAASRMAAVRGLAEAVREADLPGVIDVVPSPGRVTVVYDPPRISSHASLRTRIETIEAADVGAVAAGDVARHEILVCYGGDLGPDLDEVCTIHRIDSDRFMALHTEPDYLVEAIGFLPGFGYFTGLPAMLATPRRTTPRRVVPAGSVGIGGSQTGAYPCASPGGWNLVGSTPTRLFDASRPRPALLAVGDRVRFVAIDRGEFERRRGCEVAVPRHAAVDDAGITVVKPGLFTTIQDLGRPGHRAAGVPLSGAADSVSLRLANRLVGNPATAAAIEITLLGPDLRFERDSVVALTGAMFPGMPSAAAVPVRAGETLCLGHASTGCRGYLAVAGGINVLDVLGSRSTFSPAKLGGLRGLPLAAGDALPVGGARGVTPVTGGEGRLSVVRPIGGPITLRMIPGEQFALAGESLWSATHTTSSRSDRMGVRFDGPLLGGGDTAGSLASVAVLPGTVQLPPDGKPIVLLCDAQTIGGYPVIGHVIAADLPLVAQLRPGDRVHWREATIDEAHRALREADDGRGVAT